MGTLVTLDLEPGSALADLPWIVTIRPLGAAEPWDPVTFGPYERLQALALARVVVAEEALTAMVEPLTPHATVDAIRAEITRARAAAAAPATEGFDADTDGARRPRPISLPTQAQIRAGWVRIAAQLTGG